VLVTPDLKSPHKRQRRKN